MLKLKELLTALIKSIYLYAVLLVIMLSVYMFAAKQSTPQSTPPQPIMPDLSRPTSTDAANIATAVSTTDIISASSTSINDKTMTRDEVCEFLMETDGDPESERITPDKIEEAKNAVPSLIDYMQNGEDGLCAGLAMDVLGRTKDKRAYEPILAELYKVQGSQRISPIQALGNLGNPRALEPIISELQRGRTPHDQISLVVARALGGIKDARAVEPLIKLLQNDKDLSARYEAATSLGKIKDKRALQPLIVALQSDPDETVKGYAAEALGEIDDARAVDALIVALGQENTSSSKFILITQALAKKQDVRARNALIDKYRNLKDPSAKSYLYSTMKQGGISPDSK